MSNTRQINDNALVSFLITVDGTVIPDETQVLSIHIDKSINRIPQARISILDGSTSKGTFEASSSKTFVPGAKITVAAGYDTKNKVIFKGIITGQNLRINQQVGSLLEVECRDEAVSMIVGRKCKTYSKKKDSEIITSIIGTYSGISSWVSSTAFTWPEQVQYYVTDWDFILSRAEVNGMVVIPNDGKVVVQKPDATKSSVLTIKYGYNMLEFNGDLNAVSQLQKVSSIAWDFKTQKIVEESKPMQANGPGNLSSKKLAEVVNLTDFEQQTTAALDASTLNSWSEAQLTKSHFSKIQGEVLFQGQDDVFPGNFVTLEGLGDRFNGDYLVSGITHNISDGIWTTEAQLGLPNQWFIDQPDVVAPEASGLLPGASGLFNGVVKKMFEDPDSQYRILVDIPVFDKNGEGIWARLANFYATAGAGVFFLPEEGDEVVVGFLNEDPRFPIILGSLYSSTKNKPYNKLSPADKNPLKAIVSKSGIFIEFDDENKLLTIETPSKNTIVFSDKDKKITIKDQNSNSVEMSSSGIDIKSPKNITLDAEQKVIIKGEQGVDVGASGGDISLKGLNVKVDADAELAANAGAQAELSSGALLTLKSAMIMIN